jgi:hypothetical protein
MTARKIANMLSRQPTVLGQGKHTFVVMRMADLERLRDAYEDAVDLPDLDRASRESAGEPPTPWEKAKPRLSRRRASPRRTKKK